MKPIFKYSGGKSKEVKNILALMPEGIERIVEPFAGGAAFAFACEKPAILGDIRENVITTYKVVADESKYKDLQNLLDPLRELKDSPMDKEDQRSREEKALDDTWLTNTKKREKLFYELRDGMWDKDKACLKEEITDTEQALRWIFIRQQVFSGVDRCNRSGKMNGPFGWYNTFNCNLSDQHHAFLKNDCEIYLQSFEETIAMAGPDDFILVDPPYFERNSVYGNDNNDGESEDLHRKLAEALKKTPAKWLLIHSDCELYQELYKEFHILDKDFMYSQNFKGRDNSGSKVKHLYIKNY